MYRWIRVLQSVSQYALACTRRRTYIMQRVHAFKFMCNALVTSALQATGAAAWPFYGRQRLRRVAVGISILGRQTSWQIALFIHTRGKFHFRDTGGVKVLHKTTLIKLTTMLPYPESNLNGRLLMRRGISYKIIPCIIADTVKSCWSTLVLSAAL